MTETGHVNVVISVTVSFSVDMATYPPGADEEEIRAIEEEQAYDSVRDSLDMGDAVIVVSVERSDG